MNKEVDIEKVLHGLPESVDINGMLNAWQTMSGVLELDSNAGDEIIAFAARDMSALATGNLDPAWGGGWKWDLRGSAVRAACAAIFLGAVFASGGLASLPPIVYPAVLPLLFDLKNVRLKKSDERLLQIFGARPDFFDRCGKPQDLYDSLPDWAKGSVSYLEFVNFLDDVHKAGAANQYGELYEVLPEGKHVFRITVE